MEFKKEIRVNDLKAPRASKKEFSTIIVNEELFANWKKDNPEYKDVDIKEFRKIWASIAEEIRRESCYNALGIYFPFYTGETKIQYIPPSVKAVDRGASNELGEKIHQTNLTTKGKVGKITWQRKRAVKFNKMLNLFGFEQDRKLGMEAYEAITSNPELYRTMKIINKNTYDKQRSDSVSEKGD